MGLTGKQAQWQNRIVGYEEVDPESLLASPANWRIHPKNQQDALLGVLDQVGIVQNIIVSRNSGFVVDGHLRVSLALRTGQPSIPVTYVDLTEGEEALILATIDPLSALAETDAAKLDELLRDVATDSAAVQEMLAGLAEEAGLYQDKPTGAGGDEYDTTPNEEQTRVKFGDLWQLGEHRLLCGDSTDPLAIRRLFGGVAMDALLTDPPYCSGGFQEAGKRSGSVGTRGDEMIVNDTLSTRGYMALMKTVLGLVNAGIAYIFTDWRMWINLFDVVESSGYGVRNMVVWDKGTPGMGVGWRSQHELIMAAMKVSHPFNPKKAQGNVIACQRTGNINHATEKPVDLIVKVLEVTDLAKTVCDSFLGSGTTLIAGERTGRQVFGCELTPHYVDVSIRRWEVETGKEAVLLERVDLEQG